MTHVAERVRLAVSADASVLAALRHPSYRQYLRRSRDGPIEAGDAWRETIPRGCGTRESVTLRVVAVEGGTVLDPETAIEFERSTE